MATVFKGLLAVKAPSEALALTNCAIAHPDDVPATVNYAIIKGKLFTIRRDPATPKGSIGFSGMHRRWANLQVNEPVDVYPWDPTKEKDVATSFLFKLTLEIDFVLKNRQVAETFDTDVMAEQFKTTYLNQAFSTNQLMAFDFHGCNLQANVKSIEVVDTKAASGVEPPPPTIGLRGLLNKDTEVLFVRMTDSTVKLGGSAKASKSIIQPTFKFEDLGIGGLDDEFNTIFRRAFASRIYPQSLIQKLGVRHVKGVLLYGPPGTGKTLMARQIGKMLNAREPKIINGPEVLNKFVGQSEENIRNLFKDAEVEYKAKGDDSELHIIIFDELDAICKQRGSRNDGTGVGDSVVNQLLSKMDGVDQLNNVLIIGMTNRKDMIDEALLRPGRFEVHIEISLPDQKGRQQILSIHTAKMRQNNMLGDDVDLAYLAERTKNFSGAEIEGLVKSASSFAMNRYVKAEGTVKVSQDVSKLRVSKEDFDLALSEVTPAFGQASDELAPCIANGIIHYSKDVADILKSGDLFIKQVMRSTRTPLMSILIHGPPAVGKTALAAQLALASGYPFIKVLSPESMIGMSESQKCNAINRVFENSYRSRLSLIIVDALERLLEYVPVGPRFSNAVLQTLLVLLKRAPPPNHRLLIISTTSQRMMLERMDMGEAFDAFIPVPPIRDRASLDRVVKEVGLFDAPERLQLSVPPTEISIGVKRLIMICETARQADDKEFEFNRLLGIACADAHASAPSAPLTSF